jgi:hypothetical protein
MLAEPAKDGQREWVSGTPSGQKPQGWANAFSRRESDSPTLAPAIGEQIVALTQTKSQGEVTVHHADDGQHSLHKQVGRTQCTHRTYSRVFSSSYLDRYKPLDNFGQKLIPERLRSASPSASSGAGLRSISWCKSMIFLITLADIVAI